MRLVLLPGMDGTGDLFAPLLRALPREVEATVVRYPRDLLMGREDLQAFVAAAVPKSDPYVLVAESFSGPLAILHAAACPPGLRALVLSATFASNPLPPSLQWVRVFVQSGVFRIGMPGEFVRTFLAGRDCPPELMALVLDVFRRLNPDVMAHRLRQVMDVDVESSVPSIAVPTLYLGADDDMLVGLRGLGQIAPRLPGLKSVVLPAPHLLLQARPAEAVREILAFVGRG
jgi:pimeloyl-ACP methyl ester carboxylesterase